MEKGNKMADIDSWRKAQLAIAEWVDAWRIIPRGVVILFGYGVYHVTKWYMELTPYILEGCVEAGGKVPECIVQAPTTQHTALLSALFALAAAVFAFYSGAGRKWNGFSNWNKVPGEENHQAPKVDNVPVVKVPNEDDYTPNGG